MGRRESVKKAPYSHDTQGLEDLTFRKSHHHDLPKELRLVNTRRASFQGREMDDEHRKKAQDPGSRMETVDVSRIFPGASRIMTPPWKPLDLASRVPDSSSPSNWASS